MCMDKKARDIVAVDISLRTFFRENPCNLGAFIRLFSFLTLLKRLNFPSVTFLVTILTMKWYAEQGCSKGGKSNRKADCVSCSLKRSVLFARLC